MGDFIVSFGIPLAYIALTVAALAAIMFPVIYMLQDLKKAKSALIGVGTVAVVFLISYLLADGQDIEKATAGQMKMVEAGMYLFYILLGTSIVAILYFTVSRYFK
jgi:uncharacterized membrane protein YozB (DUF420 family)